ncbi:unnamed protein product [Rhizophagus irregularis]|nr:unnamed protein product [Rhizophagus irregularis]
MGSTFGSWALDLWISVHGFWIYGFRLLVGLWIYGFHFRLGFGYMGSTFGWALDIWISFSSRAFGYIDFDFRFLGFG